MEYYGVLSDPNVESLMRYASNGMLQRHSSPVTAMLQMACV